LWFAATNNKPNTIFASKAPSAETGTYQYTDFTLGHIASDAISLEENDMYGSKLKWIAANRLLLAATDRATWSDTGDVPTPATFDMNIIEYVGSEDMQGRGTKEALVYVGRSGKTLRALLFTVNSGNAGYIDTDISEAARHVLVKGILDFCIIEYPFSMVWIVLNDGSLVSCTLNMRAGVVAYARHPMTGTVESIAAVPGTDGDALWMVINRGNKRFVEKLVVGEVTGTEYQESHYVDSGTRIELTRASKTITGLTHLAGMEVHALGDGSIMPPRTVTADGSIIYDTPVTMLHAGLPYTSVLVPTSPEIPANGTSIGKKRRIEKVMLRLYESYGGKCGIDHERLQILGYMKYGDYIMGSAPEPFTGDQDITISGTIDTVGKIMVIHDEPVPFNLLGLVERIAIMEA
jgi:hypothetical protein